MSKTLYQCKSLYELRQVFNTDLICRQYLEQILWNGTPVCPHCATEDKIYRCKSRNLFSCGSCKKQFTITVGTIFHKTHVPLNKWFEAIWCVTNKAKGIASTQLADEIGVRQATAWFMLQRIRFAFEQRSFKAKLNGTVEIDEMYVGPNPKNMHEGRRQKIESEYGGNVRNKNIPVLGIMQRGGRVKSIVLTAANKRYIQPLIYKYVDRESIIMTDGSTIYSTIHKSYADHQTVNHSDGEYVRGKAHINSIEGHWGLFQRGLIGVYHHMSHKHLQFYYNESDFRHNVRKLQKIERFDEALNTVFCRLTYDDLVNPKPDYSKAG